VAEKKSKMKNKKQTTAEKSKFRRNFFGFNNSKNNKNCC
jgi:hypothetical protein